MMRIQKYLSQQGILSRRKAEVYLKNGWITVNGQVVTEIGVQIDPERDIVALTKQGEKDRQSFVYVVFHKPRGVLTNCKQVGETEIIDLLPKQYDHLNAIGRLDKDSEGLILLTDDGAFANQFLNSSVCHERVYEVWSAYPIANEDMTGLASGVDIGGGYITKPCEVVRVSSRRIKMTLTEGKNRQIRRMLEAVGNRVHRLKRVSFGSYQLGDLPPGSYKEVQPGKCS